MEDEENQQTFSFEKLQLVNLAFKKSLKRLMDSSK